MVQRAVFCNFQIVSVVEISLYAITTLNTGKGWSNGSKIKSHMKELQVHAKAINQTYYYHIDLKQKKFHKL